MDVKTSCFKEVMSTFLLTQMEQFLDDMCFQAFGEERVNKNHRDVMLEQKNEMLQSPTSRLTRMVPKSQGDQKSWTKTSSTSTFDHSMRHELLLNSWYKKGDTGEASERVSSIVEIVTQVMKEKRKAGHSKICTDVFEMYYNTPLYGKISISTRTWDWMIGYFVVFVFRVSS